MHYIIFTQHWSVFPPDFVLNRPGVVTIACDGACNRFQDLNLCPTIILGDFDSIRDLAYWGIQSHQTKPSAGREGCLIIPALSEDYTDLEKAIQYSDANQATEISIVTDTTERLDHTLHNPRLLRKYYRADRPIRLYTPLEVVEFVRDREFTLEGPEGLRVSLLAFPEGRFTSQGLRYEGQDFALRFAGQESICNELANTTAQITITGDILVIYAIHHN